MISAAQKVQYMELSESMLKIAIEKASMDLFFNLKISFESYKKKFNIISVDSLSAANRFLPLFWMVAKEVFVITLFCPMSSGEISIQASDMLFQYIVTKFYELSLVWKNSIFINISSIDECGLEYIIEEEKILRYIAGERHSPVGKAVFYLIDSWTCTTDKKRHAQA